MIKGFHHVALRVADFDRSVAFYTDLIGLKPLTGWTMSNGRRALILDCGDGSRIELFERPGEDAPPDSPEPILLHVCFRSTDTTADLEAVRAAGYEVTMEPTDIDIANTVAEAAPPLVPIRIAFCRGPDGELIEYFQADDI